VLDVIRKTPKWRSYHDAGLLHKAIGVKDGKVNPFWWICGMIASQTLKHPHVVVSESLLV
jgi:hypothetical protein